MASIKKNIHKNGQTYYVIRVSRGKGKSLASMRWYVPDDRAWSRKTIEREVNRIAADFERKVKNGEILTRSQIKQQEKEIAAEEAKIVTFKKYVETVFIPALTVRCAESTRDCYQRILDNSIYPVLGDKKLMDVTPADITAFLVNLQAQGKAHKTCVKMYAILNSIFKSALLDDSVLINPMNKVQRPKPRKDERGGKEPQSFTAQETKKLILTLKQEPLKWQAYVMLLIDTGLRRGEACGLKWNDINFNDRTIIISRNLCYTPSKGVYVDTPKNGKTRIVPITDNDIRLFKQLRAKQSSKCLSEWVFTQDNGPDPIHPDSPTRYLKLLEKKCGLTDLHPHKLRHSYASIAIEYGADVASVSETLGHSDKATTLRMYTHSSEEAKRKTSDIVQGALL